MKNNVFLRLILFLGIYFSLKYFGGNIGNKILYPIQLLVTFLHEFGHALGSLFTGGSVEEINISQNGAGFTKTIGGNRSVILMGGYLGSAILGNLLFLIGAKFKQIVKPILILLSLAMIFTSIYWFNSMFTSVFLWLFALAILLVLKTSFGDELLMFLGLASVLYIIQDFNVGPSSDLEKYAAEMVILPANVWMYIWLGVVLVICYYNLRFVFKRQQKQEANYPELS